MVLIHGIRDSCRTVWTRENTTNWVDAYLLKGKSVNLLEFRYDINDTAPIYSEGIETEANRLLEDLVEINKNRPVRAPCELLIWENH